MNFTGSRVGLYREGADLLPVVVRPPAAERQDANHLNNVLVWSQSRQQYIPLSNVVSDFTLEWEDPLILRRDRSRVLTVMTDPDPLSNQTSGIFWRGCSRRLTRSACRTATALSGEAMPRTPAKRSRGSSPPCR